MRSGYIYSVAIIIVLLVMLFIYSVSKKISISNILVKPNTILKSNLSGKPVSGTDISNSLYISYDSTGATIYITSATTTVQSTIFIDSTCPVSQFDSSIPPPIPKISILFVQFDGTYLNFYEDPNIAPILIIKASIPCGFSILDSSNGVMYDTSTVNFIGNSLNFLYIDYTTYDLYNLNIIIPNTFV